MEMETEAQTGYLPKVPELLRERAEIQTQMSIISKVMTVSTMLSSMGQFWPAKPWGQG
jgi:hypothetical protein